MGKKKVFDLYHFNGIAKSVLGGETPVQRPRLTKLRVSVPPRWTPEEFMANQALAPAQVVVTVREPKMRWLKCLNLSRLNMLL
ncbi:hypothetical protein HanRHA438_Chr10g0431551 [Helianthus annuus]|nr:hypothetical protein HanLR1_Chr10g0344631 [Helianthus annuus]KAJ0698810.1 hypothetical protein HanOQP8_Chr10g0348741 [Helianthus annuus]KAJ0877717.1 hypothetical protein HanRHA438_Chr10g0431551 [Helianthus annuus]KAJ0882065.1 hypothetical protein HanPSC8_Chr10g0405251 [Helianthus annuus]